MTEQPTVAEAVKYSAKIAGSLMFVFIGGSIIGMVVPGPQTISVSLGIVIVGLGTFFVMANDK
jgi:hypothetical protein